MASRPAQGNNSNRPYNRPGPAYVPADAPKVVGRGTVSRPVPLKKWNPKTDAPDKTPKVVSL